MYISRTNATISPNFNGCFVSLARKNLGQETAKNVVEAFNKNIFPLMKADADIAREANFFIPAAGVGTRFKIARIVGDYNKVNMPLTPDKESVHMLDFVLALARPFMDKKGVQTLLSQDSHGSFSGVVDYYLSGKKVKDTIICSADSIFGSDAKSLIKFLKKCIKDKKVPFAIVGGQRTPESTAGRYGVFDLKKSGNKYTIKSMIEKPDVQTAQKYAVQGENAVNSGFYYVSKEAMINLLNEIKSGNNPIKRNEKEIYDFGLAVKYILSKCKDWFGQDAQDRLLVKLSPTWTDVGEAEGFYSLMQGIKNGEFLQVFPRAVAKKTQEAVAPRVHLSRGIPYINFTDSKYIDMQKFENALTVDGVKIIK